MPKVAIEDLQIVRVWLSNDIDCADVEPGRAHEVDALIRVNDWLKAEILRRQDAADIRSIAKLAGVSSAKVRQELRRRDATHESS